MASTTTPSPNLEKILSYFLPILYFVISVSFYLRTYDSCMVKITLIQMGGVVILTLWLIKLFEEWDVEFYHKNLVIVIPILLVLISNVFSHFRSPLKYASGMELIRKAIYLGIALLVIKEINSEQKFRRVLNWLFFACFVSTFYGVIQYLDTSFFPPGQHGGLDPFIWRWAFGGRVFSTFGNPNFFGDFLVVMGPIVLAMALKTRRLYLIILYLMTAFCVRYTYSKGTWIGFVSGFVAFCILYTLFFSYAKKGNIRKLIIGIVIVITLICAGGVYFQTTRRTDSVKFRVYTWLSCWEMINSRPILGTGIGTFYVTYPAWRRPQIFFIEGKHNTESDHPENEYLEVWFDEGTIGFGIFLWLILVVGLMGYRGLRTFSKLTTGPPGNPVSVKEKKRHMTEDPRAYYMLGLLSAFIGMLTHNIVCVSLRFVSSGIMFWLLVGLIVTLIVNNPLPRKSMIAAKKNSLFIIPDKTIYNVVFTIIKLGLAILVIYFSYNIVSEFRKIQGNYPFSGGEQLLWLIAWGVFLLGVCFVTVVMLKVIANSRNFAIVLLIPVCIYLSNIFWGFFVGDAHHNMAIFHSKKGQWSQALENYNIVARRNPGFIMAHYFMGNVFNDRHIRKREYHPEWGDSGDMARIDLERSLAKYDDVKRIAPNYVQAHHQVGLAYAKFADDAEKEGNIEKAKEYRTKAIESFEKYHLIDPIFPQNYYRLASLYLRLKEVKKAEETYLRHLYTLELFEHKNRMTDVKLDEVEWVKKQMGVTELPTGIKECEIHKGKYLAVARENWSGRRYHQYAETCTNLGNVNFMNNNIAKAEYYYKKALELKPDNTNAIKNLAILYGRTGQRDKSIAMWNKLRMINPNDPDVKKVFGQKSKMPIRVQ